MPTPALPPSSEDAGFQLSDPSEQHVREFSLRGGARQHEVSRAAKQWLDLREVRDYLRELSESRP